MLRSRFAPLRVFSTRSPVVLAVLACAVLPARAVAVELAAEPAPANSSAVIAESSRVRLTLADYQAELAKLPESARATFGADDVQLHHYLDNLYLQRVLAADARAAGLDKDPVIARQIATEVDRVLARAETDRLAKQAAAAFEANKAIHVARAKELYAVDPARYTVPERVRAAHILVKIVDGDREAAYQTAEKIRARAIAGEDFGKLAKEYSADTLTADKGGELGFFTAGAMDPAFAKAAFALGKPGDISEPVLTRFGYHLIRLEARTPAGLRPFEEVEPEIMAKLKEGAIDDARTAARRAIFADPTLKVDSALIEELNAKARANVRALTREAPPPIDSRDRNSRE